MIPFNKFDQMQSSVGTYRNLVKELKTYQKLCEVTLYFADTESRNKKDNYTVGKVRYALMMSVLEQLVPTILHLKDQGIEMDQEIDYVANKVISFLDVKEVFLHMLAPLETPEPDPANDVELVGSYPILDHFNKNNEGLDKT